ncbi:PIN domain-containing protein [Thermogladius sp. 4427co]|uniref:PIN domain-containing protein n=1 Tax=Thermogladius sp. 4427co TaxID=3450718 RepID=UPI003F792B02
MGYYRSYSKQRKVKLVFDTNFIVTLADYPYLLSQLEDLFADSNYECVIPDIVISELEKIRSSLGLAKARMLENIVRYLEGKCSIAYLSKGQSVDEAIVSYALENHGIVATNDRDLRRKLRGAGIPCIYFREESKRIEIEGEILYY